MIRLDSCTISVKSDAIKYVDLHSFIHKPQIEKGNVISDIYQLKTPMPGINSIIVDERNELLKLQFSAKILLDNYFQGINKNTIHNAIDNINQLGIIDVDVNKVIDNGNFQNIDNTNNVNMGWYDMQSRWKEFITSMSIAKNNSLFSTHTWNRSNNKGIEYRGGQTTKKNRFIMYDKFIDLTQPKNQQFLSACSNPLALLNSSKNILRIESNTTNFSTIRERCKTTTTNVNEVLNGMGMPNIYMLDKITQPNKVNQMQMMFDEYDPGKFNFKQVMELEGIKHIIKSFNYDEEQLKQFVYAYDKYETAKKNWNGRKGYPGIKHMLQQLKQIEQTNTPEKNIVLDHVRQLLLNDYAIAI